MTRSSPAILRAASILDYIAEHPGQSFTMAELVRALKLSHSTCHSLLAALVQVGYLYKTTDRAYVLGSGLASIGRQAAERFSLLEIARPELRRLANSLDLVSSALVLEGGKCVVRERSASASHVGFVARIGTTLRFRAHLAALFFAKTPDLAESWLAGFSPDVKVVAAERAVMETGIAFFQRYGFIALMFNQDAMVGKLSLESSFDGDIEGLPVYITPSIDEDRTYDLSSIICPVYNETGNVDFIVSLFGYRGSLSGTELLSLGLEVQTTCARISAFALEPHRRSRISPV